MVGLIACELILLIFFTDWRSFSCCSLTTLLVSNATLFWCISSCLLSSRRASAARRSSSVINSSLPWNIQQTNQYFHRNMCTNTPVQSIISSTDHGCEAKKLMLWNSYIITNSKVQKHGLKTNTPISNESAQCTGQTFADPSNDKKIEKTKEENVCGTKEGLR